MLKAVAASWSAAERYATSAESVAVARPSRAFAILVSTSSGVSNPSTVESRGQRAGVRLAWRATP